MDGNTIASLPDIRRPRGFEQHDRDICILISTSVESLSDRAEASDKPRVLKPRIKLKNPCSICHTSILLRITVECWDQIRVQGAIGHSADGGENFYAMQGQH